MEPKIKHVSTDIQIHSRHIRPSVSFENVKKVADKKGSKEIRCYGEPMFELDLETKEIRLVSVFYGDIADKIRNGELIIQENTEWIVDQETVTKLKNNQKKKLKSATRTWKKDL